MTASRQTRNPEPPATAAEARAAVEADRRRAKAERAAQMRARYGDTTPGRAVIWCSWAATVVFAAVTVPALVDPDAFVGLFFGVSVLLFFVGCAVFVVDLALAAARSRDDEMGIGGLFFLIGSAPRRVQVHLLSALAAQVAVATIAAAVRPFTPLAFGTLVPILGLAACGFWSVRHGLFARRAR